LLQAARLPERSDPGWEQLYGSAGLVPTASEEKARLSAALGGELARSIEVMDGVVDARVHLSLPNRVATALDASPPKPRASVMVKYRHDAPPVDERAIRTLVTGATPNMDPENVAIVVVKAAPKPRAAVTLVQIGPVVVTADTASSLKTAAGAALALFILLAATVIALLTRLRRASAAK
jgi:type III secretion protein J